MSTEATPGALGLGEGLGPFAELHEPASEFEDGTWHKPLPQGWSGGRLVYTAEQVAAAVAIASAKRVKALDLRAEVERLRSELAAERERWKVMLLAAAREAYAYGRDGKDVSIECDDKGWRVEWRELFPANR